MQYRLQSNFGKFVIALFTLGIVSVVSFFGAGIEALLLMATLIVLYAIMRNPVIGLGITMGSTIVLEILPDIPLFTSLTVLLGAATVLSYFISRRWQSHESDGVIANSIMVVTMIAFIAWMVFSNVNAAFGLTSNRNWVLTFVQLLVLTLLGPRVLRTIEQQRLFMIIIIIVTLISAVVSIQQVQSLGYGTRVAGLNTNQNFAARSAIIGIVFTYYLFVTTQHVRKRWLLFITLVILALFVFNTISRAGIIMLAVTYIALILFVSTENAQQKARSIVIPILFAIAFLIVIPQGLRDSVSSRFLTTQVSDEEKRFVIWTAAVEIFWDNPLTGVGIGRFRYYLEEYNDVDLEGFGTHNAYLSVLSETGIVGFAIYMVLIIVGIRTYFQTMKMVNPQEALVLKIWFIVLCTILLSGLSTHNTYEKMLWLAFGMGLSFRRQSRTVPSLITTPALLATNTPVASLPNQLPHQRSRRRGI